VEFSEIYDEHVFTVFGFFAYRVVNRVDAEDLTQVTFEKALRAWPRYDPRRAPPRAWLLAIARNALIDHVRAKKPSGLSLDDDLGDGALPYTEGPEANLGLSAELEAALRGLTTRDREIVALRFGADLTGPEIAEMLGLTLANVQQILSRSLRRLKGELDEFR